MAEKAVPVLKEVPYYNDVYDQHRDDDPGKLAWTRQFIDFNRDKKGRFPDCHPSGPAYAKYHPSPLDQRKKTVKTRPGGGPQNVCFRQLANLFRKMCEELVPRVDSQHVEDR